MEYFLTHLPHILIMGLFLGGLAAIYAFVGIKNEKERDFNDERCEFKCESCGNSAICNKEGKKEV